MHGWKICHLYWKVMNHAMYTTQTRRGYSSTCFLIEHWRIKEKLAMEENIPKTDSLCYCVLTVMEVISKSRLWLGNPQNQGASRTLKKLPIKYHTNSKAWMTTDFLFVPPFFRHANGGANRKVILFVDNCAAHPKDTPFLLNVRVVRYPANCTSALQPLP
jgi:hypothetical protein